MTDLRKTFGILAAVLAAWSVCFGDAFGQGEHKIAEEIVERTAPRWVPEIVRGTPAASKCLPFLGKAFGAAGAAVAFCAFPDKLADGTLTGRTTVRTGFATPHAVTSEDLLEYFSKVQPPTIVPVPQPISTVRNSLEPEGKRGAQEPSRKEKDAEIIKKVLEDLKHHGPIFKEVTASLIRQGAEPGPIFIFRALTLNNLLRSVRLAHEQNMNITSGLSSEERPIAEVLKHYDAAFRYYGELAALALGEYGLIGTFKDSFDVLASIHRAYSKIAHRPSMEETYLGFVYRTMLQTLDEGFSGVGPLATPYVFPTGSVAQTRLAVTILGLRHAGTFPEKMKIQLSVSDLGKNAALDMPTIETVLVRFWKEGLKQRNPEDFFVGIKPEGTGRAKVFLSGTIDSIDWRDLKGIEQSFDWFKNESGEFGISDAKLRIRSARGGGRPTLTYEFTTPSQPIWK